MKSKLISKHQQSARLRYVDQSGTTWGNRRKLIPKRQDGGNVSKEDEAANRALRSKAPASNYSRAVDMDISSVREGLTDLVQRIGDCFGIHAKTGLSNCTLTATQWVNPKIPIGRAATIVTNPGKYQYEQIHADYAIPGNLVIASKDPKQYIDGENNVYHTMVITGFADKDHIFSYGDKNYKIKKGEPLVSYSRGQNMPSELRKNIPLSVYNDQGEGKTYNRFYRLKTNETYLPEAVVIGNKNK